MVTPTAARARDAAAVIELLQAVKDPEVPVLSVVELGLVRGVDVNGNAVHVQVTPTYSGCPALNVIEENIACALREAGFDEVHVERVFQPVWTTDFIDAAAREKLRAYGIAPPIGTATEHGAEPALLPLEHLTRRISCPFCGSNATRKESDFGSTACKAFYFCSGCQQPFEYFKAI